MEPFLNLSMKAARGSVPLMDSTADRLVRLTERYLTWRARRRATKRYKQKQKGVVRDWIEAFLWAAGVVLLINQYLFQAYQIPSGSMISTLNIGDRIFVNKLVYGPELIPGEVKLPGFARPQRNEVIIFENPSYIGKGPLFDILQRVIYMLTLSLVDIDRDEFGRPRDHFLIKRAVGQGGDRFRIVRGEVEILAAGASEWLSEAEFQRLTGSSYTPRRIITPADYEVIERAGVALGRRDLGFELTDHERASIDGVRALRYVDPFELERHRQRTILAVEPDNAAALQRLQFIRTGWYVPYTRVFPMGDNRDNSRDGRYFGAVARRHVLGRAMFIYWPLARLGTVR